MTKSFVLKDGVIQVRKTETIRHFRGSPNQTISYKEINGEEYE